jgi:hypothetical protein
VAPDNNEGLLEFEQILLKHNIPAELPGNLLESDSPQVIEPPLLTILTLLQQLPLMPTSSILSQMMRLQEWIVALPMWSQIKK